MIPRQEGSRLESVSENRKCVVTVSSIDCHEEACSILCPVMRYVK